MKNTCTRRSFIVVSDITDTVEDSVRARYSLARIIRKEALPVGNREVKGRSIAVR